MNKEIQEVSGAKIERITDPTWGTGIMYKRLMLVAVKQSGEITEGEKHSLLAEACGKSTDHGTMSLTGMSSQGQGLLLVFDVYMVEQLSVFKRLRHATRMLKAAITGNIHVGSGVRVVVIK